MATDIAGDFTAACRVADMDCVFQVERFEERRKIVGIGIHVVAVPRLARSAMATAVMSDGAETMGGEKHHLIFPGVGTQRPAMAKDDGLAHAPILVVNLRAVFGRNRAHGCLLSVRLEERRSHSVGSCGNRHHRHHLS